MSAPLLQLRGLSVAYGALTAVHEVDLAVAAGEAVALLGANGAGKSTLINTIAGLVPAAAGSIHYNGRELGRLPPEARARAGLGYSPEGRRIFPGMTVRENLEVGCWAPKRERVRRFERVFDLFPGLRQRCDTPGWQLSGGQQQMVSIGRALVGNPRLMLLDEPSLGLSPILVAEVLATVRRIADTGTAVLLAEQNAARALDVCDRAYVLKLGRVAASGPAAELRDGDRLRDAFLGG
ncbi:MAG: ABC transporter ATP-binding protein [Alphaproteobacteria bacterium]|nr:ABC transporter ATP-binding protein [Alphaproteobacteria bacterium]